VQIQKETLPLLPLSERRPLGITILAILNYVNAGFAFFLAIAALSCKARVMATILRYFDRSRDSADPNSYVLGVRVSHAAEWFLISMLLYFFGWGLWRLKYRTRIIVVILFVLSLIAGMLPYILWPASVLIKGVLFSTVGGRAISFILVWYLVDPRVKAAFGAVATGRKSQLALGAFALLWLAFAIPKSGPELEAIRWHKKHGNQITVNGVTFPLYYWYVPDRGRDELSLRIWDDPGPLRQAILKDTNTDLWIEGFKTEDETLSVDQLVRKRMVYYQKTNVDETREFQMQIRTQALICVEAQVGSGKFVDCYGDGPIYSAHLYGNEASHERFMRMMAEAH
jgi:hypothetical protein